MIDAIEAVVETGNNIIDKIWEDADEAGKRKQYLATLAHEGDLARLNAEVQLMVGQLEINKQEAAHRSVFVAGWRPAVGWVCVVALAYHFVIMPFLNWILFSQGGDISEAPVVNITELIGILGGMLGFGLMRMREKEKNIASDSIGPSKR
ncbi:hypothetical protein AD45P2_00430 [Alteromonas phage vB_AmaP_AD45-P2]|uniref:Holin of 3TMs, for gene-transfer release n=1 Tax=Pseudorhizobium pelagicum TaxID=1509405 RepID=A0A922NYP7_9HYPH|nr:holin family protein [Pseudorhizobium pelagicum]YP_008126056.1 holin [Alteromonas phage vB_AmaP_AD45-P1]AGM47019.1 hypothetical protein AD45P3_00405 [Alteromonas phage vB_AmaP_AD45-P3]AGM47135.1 hypothetical protein AD45P4_00400 [Alteromonas phage vB_AmaP_AD45-P4]AGM47257.1 hypothetical protein AD45P2_00430 [Alteromonas phage vB_AmaP_AD45-P2]AGM46903.1 hypothetical protein AD45P1_00425 [Alteromonas phage vB_AmaP_AD45-P1]KEQ05623.1 hypothetical protein GV68_08830 [Pseudorhizobium pelagicum]